LVKSETLKLSASLLVEKPLTNSNTPATEILPFSTFSFALLSSA
jgi:hypothetical protein